MRRWFAIVGLVLAAGCDGGSSLSPSTGRGSRPGVDAAAETGVPSVLTAEEQELAATLTPLPVPPADATIDPRAALLGQRLFFESGSGPRGEGGQAARADGRAGRWGRWDLPLAVAENPKNPGSDRLRVAHALFDRYRADYQAIFEPLDPALADATRFPPSGQPKAAGAADGAWERMAEADRSLVDRIFSNYGELVEAYVRRLARGRSRFDEFMGGDEQALDPEEVSGLRLFIGKAGCVRCHSGPQLTDAASHDTGVPRAAASERGRFADVSSAVASPLKGQFRTPSLRNVAETAPYMHDGQLATLEAVIDFYDRGGDAPAAGTKDPLMRPLELSPPEKAQLVAFLRTLSAPLAPPTLADELPAR